MHIVLAGTRSESGPEVTKTTCRLRRFLQNIVSSLGAQALFSRISQFRQRCRLYMDLQNGQSMRNIILGGTIADFVECEDLS